MQNKLVFDDEKIRIEVFYKEELLAFRSCDEGNRWKTVDSVLGMKGKEFFKNKLFFKVENSNSKKWYSQETFNTSKENEFEHYAFVTMNDIIDVLALHEPTIRVTKIYINYIQLYSLR